MHARRVIMRDGLEATSLRRIAREGGFTTGVLTHYFADKSESICTSIERLATLPFVAQPGEEWVYGYNTDILGCVVERASKIPLDQFIATRITTPLGMKDTRFYLPPDQRARLATVYSSGPDGRIVRAPGFRP